MGEVSLFSDHYRIKIWRQSVGNDNDNLHLIFLKSNQNPAVLFIFAKHDTQAERRT